MGSSTFFNNNQTAAAVEFDYQQHSLLGAPPANPTSGHIRSFVDDHGVMNLLDADGDSLKVITGTQSDVDDAVSDKHAAGTDQGLDTGGTNAVTAADVKSAIDLKHSNATDHSNTLDHSNSLDHSNAADHTQGTDTGLDTGGTNPVTAATIKGVTDLVSPGAGANSVIVGTGGAGHLNTAAGTCNIVGGNDNTAAGNNNLVVGEDHATVAGNDNLIAGKANAASTAGSHYNSVAGESNAVEGTHNLVAGYSHVVTGNKNAVSGNDNICIGSNNHVEGSANDLQASDSHCEGTANSSNGFNHVHMEGKNCAAYNHTQQIKGGGIFTDGDPGCCQVTHIIAKGVTPSDDPVDLLVDPTYNIVLAQFKIYAFFIRVLATSGDYASAQHATIAGMIKRGELANTTALIGTPVLVNVADNTGDNITIEATADTTNGALKVTATGLHDTPMHWVAYIEMVETNAF
jgi:hypothetical protein